MTEEKLNKSRLEALNCSVEDIRNTAKHLRSFLSQNKLVVIGSAAKIKEEKELFDKIENLF